MILNLYGVRKQLDFIASPARYRGFFAGRRVGKSYAFCNDVIKEALSKPNRRLLYLTHSNPLARELFEMLAFHPALRMFIDKHRQKEPYTITFKNGSRIEFRNWSKIDLIRGFKYHVIYIDEIQQFPERFMAIVEPCIKDTRGKLVVMGQFNGFNWYFNRFYLQGQSSVLLNIEGTPLKDSSGNLRPNLSYKSWHMPSSEGLMFQGALGEAELEETRLLTPPNVFDQEYNCLPTASLTAVFPYDELQQIAGGTLMDSPDDSEPNIQAIDTGKVVDHTVSIVMGAHSGCVKHVKIFANNVPYPRQALECGIISRTFHTSALIDSTGQQGAAGGKTKDPIVPIFRQQIPYLRPFIFSMTSKNHMVAHLGIEIRNKNIKIPEEAKEVHRQLAAYEYKYRGSGFLTYSAPKGDHDDCVTALMMAAWARHNNWYGTENNTGTLGQFVG